MYFAFLEFLGTTEIMVILVAALLLFGPRRLPQLSRSLGRSLSDFKRASEEFKRTWEKEVEMESLVEEGRIARAMLQDDPYMIRDDAEKMSAVETAADAVQPEAPPTQASTETPSQTVARSAPDPAATQPSIAGDEPAATKPKTDWPLEASRKRDWF